MGAVSVSGENGDPGWRDVHVDRLYRAYEPEVRSYARRAWSSLDDDEIVAQTFEVAWRRLADAPVNAPRAWLIAIARNCALNEARARRRRQSQLTTLISARVVLPAYVSDDCAFIETCHLLKSALCRLTVADQEILKLAAFDELTNVEIAGVLGISGGAAAVRLFRARQRLEVAISSLADLD